MNFYQNRIWRTISKDIFKKDIFEYYLFWKKYWWVKKTHNKFWIKAHWYQILWIEIPNNINSENFKQEIKYLKTKYNAFNDIFFQLWFINSLSEPFFENRQDLNKQFSNDYWIYPSIKENMPLATVFVDITRTEDDILKDFSKSARRNIRKAEKEWIYFTIAKDNDIDNFYELWAWTAKLKWFHIYPKQQYLKLVSFLKNTWSWDLYLVKKDDTIISGSIEINENNYSYYLYGATNRDFIKLWWHYFLKYQMFKYLKNKWIKKVDLLWVAPIGYENHHLSWVSQFKNSLWWKHIEYFWNYDVILNKFWYNALKTLISK